MLDGVGNRTSQTLGSTTTSFTLNSDDQLTATSGGFTNSYGYNANGEQTSRTLAGTAYTLSYDYDGQLTSSVQGSNTTSFTYDALGRRVSRTAGGTTTNFLYGGSKVLLEKQGSTYTATYTYGNALLRKDGEYPLFDGLGSERTVTNSSQTVTGTLMLDGFGLTVNTTGSSTDPYMFGATSGYRNDGDAGLMQVGARYYDAQVGRFITRDTLLSEPPYVYCEGDPVNYVDPSGHIPGWLKTIGRGLLGFGVGTVVRVVGTVAIGIALSPILPVAGAFVVGGIIAGAIGGVIGAKIAGVNPWAGGLIGGVTGGLGAPFIQGAWELPAAMKALQLSEQLGGVDDY